MISVSMCTPGATRRRWSSRPGSSTTSLMSVMQMRKRRCASRARSCCGCPGLRQLGQHLAQVRVDALGMRRGLHALRGAGEEAVVEVRAQLVQRRAGRRLRHAQPLGGLGDVAGLVDLVEHGEPFEIELGHGRVSFGAECWAGDCLRAKDTIIEISNFVYWLPVLRK
jgi:hypothetical protein